MVGRMVDRQRQERVLLELSAPALGPAGGRPRRPRDPVRHRGQLREEARGARRGDRGAGACELIDTVQVRLPGSATRSDAEVAAAVARALEWDVFVPDRRIRLAVRSGTITLDGEVDYSWQRQDTLRVVRHVAGVTAIEDHIHVRSSPDPPPPDPRPQRSA